MSNLKILRINSIPNLAKEYFNKHQLHHLDYDKQVKIIMQNNFAHPGSWGESFKSLGVKSFDIVPNFESLQKNWIKKYSPQLKYNYLNTILKQISYYKPNVIFIYAGAFTDSFPIDLRKDLKKKFPFIKILTGLWGDHLIGSDYKSSFKDLDFIFTNCKILENEINIHGLNAIHLGNAFDPFIINDYNSFLKTEVNKVYDVVFSGESGFNKFDHIERYHFLKHLMNKTNLTLFAEEYIVKNNLMSKFKESLRINIIKSLGYIPTIFLKTIINNNNNFRINRVFKEAILSKKDRLFLDNPFKNEKSLKELFPERVMDLTFSIKEYYMNIKKSKIGINIHRNDPTDVGNIRTFEITGLNSLLLTDKGEELKDYFKINHDYVSYKNEKDCEDKIKYFLKNDKELNEISNNGMVHCLKYHTVKNRCELIKEVLEKRL